MPIRAPTSSSRRRRERGAGAVRRDRRGDPDRARSRAHRDRAARRGAGGGGVRAERARVASVRAARVRGGARLRQSVARALDRARVTGVTTYQRIFWLLPVACRRGRGPAPRCTLGCAARFCEQVRRARSARARRVSGGRDATARDLRGQPGASSSSRPRSSCGDTRARCAPGVPLGAARNVRAGGQRAFAAAADRARLRLPDRDRRSLAERERNREGRRATSSCATSANVATSRDSAGWFVSAAVSLPRRRRRGVARRRHNARVKSLIRLAGYERIGEVDWDLVFARMPPRARQELAGRRARPCRFAAPITACSRRIRSPPRSPAPARTPAHRDPTPCSPRARATSTCCCSSSAPRSCPAT